MNHVYYEKLVVPDFSSVTPYEVDFLLLADYDELVSDSIVKVRYFRDEFSKYIIEFSSGRAVGFFDGSYVNKPTLAGSYTIGLIGYSGFVSRDCIEEVSFPNGYSPLLLPRIPKSDGLIFFQHSIKFKVKNNLVHNDQGHYVDFRWLISTTEEKTVLNSLGLFWIFKSPLTVCEL